MIWLTALAWGSEPSVLDDPSFRFCHEYAAFDHNDTFCELVEHVDPERCPGLHQYCAAPEDAPASGCQADSFGSGQLGTLPTAPEPASDPSWNPFSMSGATLEGTQALVGWIVAMVVALLLLGIAGLVLRFVGFRRPQETLRVTRTTAELEAQPFAQAVDDVPDLPSTDLLEAAERALEQGRYGEASVLARGAVLRQLGERRVLKLHRARTDLEYVQQAQGDQRPLLAEVLAMAARHRWGRIPLDAVGVRHALDAARRLLALTLFLVALAAPAHAFDRYGPAGDVALRRLLENGGAKVTYRTTPLASLDPDDAIDVLVLDLSGIAPTEADWDAIEAWVVEGHVLWVAGDPAPLELFGDRFPVDGPFVNWTKLRTPYLGPSPLGFPLGTPILISETSDLSPVVWTELGEGVVLAMADPHSLWNGSVVHPDNEAFLSGILDFGEAAGWPLPAQPRVELCTTAGSDTPPQTALANLRLLPFVLQVLLIWLVVVAWKGWPFRRNRGDDQLADEGFRAHVDAVADQYRRLKATGHTTAAYARWVLQVEGREGLQLLARRAGYSPQDAEGLVERTAAAAEGALDQHEHELEEELWKLMQNR